MKLKEKRPKKGFFMAENVTVGVKKNKEYMLKSEESPRE